jgi:6-pyruvoyltetrahydropterin/6-carboxytetrahydropterin synthase
MMKKTIGEQHMMNEVSVCKIFTFDSAHQLIGHSGKCANVHGHTYKLEVVLKAPVIAEEGASDEGFVMDFSRLKSIVKEHILSRLDHAFLAAGNEPVLESLQNTGSKIAKLGFRTTAENLASYICWRLLVKGLPVFSVKLWETGSAWAEVAAADIPAEGPVYRKFGDCDF